MHRSPILACVLLFALASCKTVTGAIVGAGAGSLLGPLGAVGGAAAGAGGGHMLDENTRLKEELEEARSKLEDQSALKREVSDLRSRLDKTKTAPPAAGPLDLSYGPQLPWYMERFGWFTVKGWGLIALALFVAFRFRAGLTYLVGLVPWASILSWIFGKKQSGTSPPLTPKLQEETQQKSPTG